MPKRINRIRGILRPLLATCSRNNAIHEISSAESKCIIFCRASALLPTQNETRSNAREKSRRRSGSSARRQDRASHMRLTPKARDAEPHCFHGTTQSPASPYATFSARSWHDGLKMTKDRNAVENRRFNRLKWLEKHERSAVDAHKRTITPRFAKFSQVAYYNETPFSPPTPMFRDFQAISASSARSFARQRKQEVEMPRVVGEGTRGFAHNATSPKEGGRLAEGRPSLKSHFASQTKGNREPLDMNRRAANAFNARTWRRRRRGGGSARRWRAGRRLGCSRGC